MRCTTAKWVLVLAGGMAMLLGACASGGTTESGTPTTTATSSTSTSSSTTSSTATSSTATSSSTTSSTSTSSSTTLVLAEDPSGPTTQVIELGRSVQDRAITVFRTGSPGATAVLVVGVIHGNEGAGRAIAERLLAEPPPPDLDLWVVPSMNPDGEVLGTRHNANGVDLNRNFPEAWDALGAPGDWQYGGPAPASEPETRALLALAEVIRPDLVLWYHQDLFRINPATGRDGEIRALYAELTGLPLVPVTGGTYTGTASIWSRSITAPGGVGFTVELGPTLDDGEALRHAGAVLAAARALAQQ